MGRNITLYISLTDEAKIQLLRQYLITQHGFTGSQLTDENVIMAAFDMCLQNKFGEVTVGSSRQGSRWKHE